MPNCGNKSWTTVYKLSTEKIDSLASNGFQSFHALFHALVSNLFEHTFFLEAVWLACFFLNVSFVFFGHGFWLEFVGENFCLHRLHYLFKEDNHARQNMQTKTCRVTKKHANTCEKTFIVQQNM